MSQINDLRPHYDNLLNVCDALQLIIELMANNEQKPYPHMLTLLKILHQQIEQSLDGMAQTLDEL